jgi:aryl-alcohol dehydrogenase-like predicted oxidoreductase
MEYRFIPKSDLRVSALCFGNFIYGSFMWGKTAADAPEGVRLQNLAFDLGVNFFDTADAYDNGRAEELMRPTLAYAGRDRIVLSTKFGYDFHSDPGTAGSHRERKQDFSPTFIRAALEASLQRLGTDYIDLWQAHNIKLPHIVPELQQTLEDLRRAGKIRQWGLALGPAIGWREEGVIGIRDWHAATMQTVFNMFEQHPGRELCELGETYGSGIIARVPHSSGILQDIYTPDMKFDDHRKFRDKSWLIYGIKKLEFLRHIQRAHGVTMAELALQWLMTWPAMLSVQPNIMNEAELRQFATACDGQKLSAAEMREIQDLVESDFGLGSEAHACELKSSIDPAGRTPSHYQGGQSAGLLSPLSV